MRHFGDGQTLVCRVLFPLIRPADTFSLINTGLQHCVHRRNALRAASTAMTCCGEAVETAFVSRAFFHRAEAPVLMKDTARIVKYPG
jgi:hypothetical protein